MQRFGVIPAAAFALALAMTGAAQAQSGGTAAPAAPPAQPAPAQPGAAAPAANQPYVREKSGDWDVRCQKAQDGTEHCDLHQLIRQASGNPIADIAVGPLPPGQPDVAGAMILTPLETLLTRNLGLSIDGGPTKEYPFGFCNRAGCYVRVNFSAPELAQLEKGKKMTITIYAVQNASSPINLDVSLNGFSKGYDALLK
jgi:invasion protein IalB